VKKNNSLAVASLLTAALVWGLIWFPYRALDAAGAGGALASFLTYFFALLPGLALLRGRRTQIARSGWLLAAMALAAGSKSGCALALFKIYRFGPAKCSVPGRFDSGGATRQRPELLYRERNRLHRNRDRDRANHRRGFAESFANPGRN